MRSRSAKPILDEIDRVLAAYYGFTDEELHFIPSTKLRTGINYDIKYRMGRDAEAERTDGETGSVMSFRDASSECCK
jgi:hypothetical protein